MVQRLYLSSLFETQEGREGGKDALCPVSEDLIHTILALSCVSRGLRRKKKMTSIFPALVCMFTSSW